MGAPGDGGGRGVTQEERRGRKEAGCHGCPALLPDTSVWASTFWAGAREVEAGRMGSKRERESVRMCVCV